MSRSLSIFAAALVMIAPATLLAAEPVDSGTDAWAAMDAAESNAGATTAGQSKFKPSYEFDADASYVGDARTNYGSGVYGNVSEERANARFVLGEQYNDGPIYRFGLAYQRYSFGLSRAAPFPNSLQDLNAVVGVDFELFDSWLVRAEADPGIYNDGRYIGLHSFNVPFSIGGSYIASEELQWVLGLEVDIDRQIPVFPAIGMRWEFIDQWVLDAILPTPRLEYDWSKALTLYLGGDVDDGTYRVDRDFGTAIGKRDLNGAVLEYDEVRVGAGFSWKASKALTFELEGGYLPYREFDFHRVDVHYSNEDGAPYAQMSLNAQF